MSKSLSLISAFFSASGVGSLEKSGGIVKAFFLSIKNSSAFLDFLFPSRPSFKDWQPFKKFNENYYKRFETFPNEITILAYDALGLIYYVWKKNGKINSINDFSFKNKIKGKIGTFSFKDKKVIQDLEIYKTEKNKFIKF